MKNLSYLILILLFGCCDCLDPSDPIPPFCSPQEATITEFISEFTSSLEQDEDGNDIIVFEPTPPYSTHGFRFPDQLLVDERFDAESGVDRISVEEEFLPVGTDDGALKIAVLSGIPINEDQNADIIVSSVDLGAVPRLAELRFKGRLNFYDDNQTSESSEEFCDYIEQNGIDMQELPLFRFGEDVDDNTGNISRGNDLSNGVVSLIGEDNSILIVDIQNPNPARNVEFEGEIQTEVEVLNEIELRLALGNFGGNILNTNAYTNLQQKLADNEYLAIDIEVNIGDVFVYEAINGLRYAVNIINISERDNNAIKERVSIQYSKL